MKILVSLNIPSIGIQLLKENGHEITVWDKDTPMSAEQLLSAAKAHEALLTGSFYSLDGKFLRECTHLKIISQFSVGYDNIDLAEATRLKIPFANAPGAMSNATADVAFTLMLCVSRKVCYMHKKILAGEWTQFGPQEYLGFELKNKTLGIFGLGSIGYQMALRCKGAYQMELIYYNRNRNKEAERDLGARYVSFDQLLAQSDVLSVHCALNNETKGFFNADVFEKMKPTSIFINTARGGIHVEDDLLKALKKKQIWGVGLDVTDPEPMESDNELLQMENVAIVPHIGSATVEARTEMARLAAQNILDFVNGKPIENLVNKEVYQ